MSDWIRDSIMFVNHLRPFYKYKSVINDSSSVGQSIEQPPPPRIAIVSCL
jgi:hypothetical protein